MDRAGSTWLSLFCPRKPDPFSFPSLFPPFEAKLSPFLFLPMALFPLLFLSPSPSPITVADPLPGLEAAGVQPSNFCVARHVEQRERSRVDTFGLKKGKERERGTRGIFGLKKGRQRSNRARSSEYIACGSPSQPRCRLQAS